MAHVVSRAGLVAVIEAVYPNANGPGRPPGRCLTDAAHPLFAAVVQSVLTEGSTLGIGDQTPHWRGYARAPAYAAGHHGQRTRPSWSP